MKQINVTQKFEMLFKVQKSSWEKDKMLVKPIITMGTLFLATGNMNYAIKMYVVYSIVCATISQS